MNLLNMFTEYCVVEEMNLDLAKINNYCYERKKIDSGVIVSNIGGWHSSNINDEPASWIKNFKNEVLNRIEKISMHTGRHPQTKYKFCDIWININQKNNFNKTHDHPGNCFSGSFYVSCGENCGRLCFDNSNNSAWSIPKTTVKEYTPYNSETYFISPKNNLLVFFPSHLKHYVEPNLSNKDRISISFNVDVIK